MLLQALCIILYPLVNSNWSYSLETPNLGQNQRFFLAVWPSNLKDDLQKTIGRLFYYTLSFVHHSNAIGKFKLKLQSGKAQLRSNQWVF